MKVHPGGLEAAAPSAAGGPGSAAAAVHVCVNEERLRLFSYLGFVGVVLCGVVLAKAGGDVDMETTLLKRMYGYNNVCVYFDYAPATYVLPVLWAAELVLFVDFLQASLLRYRTDVAAGRMTPRMAAACSALVRFTLAGAIVFSLIFALKYDTHNAREERGLMILHTVPFFVLQLALCSLAVSATVHGVASGYWTRCGMPAWAQRSAYAYCAALVAICTYKIAYCVYCWTEFPVVDGATYELVGTTKTVDADTLAFNDLPSGLTSFSTLVDTLFLIFALAIPFGKTVWLLYFSKGGKDASGLYMTVRSSMDADAAQKAAADESLGVVC